MTEEIVLMFRDKEEPKAIMYSNGSHTFFKLKKMTREEIASLLAKNDQNVTSS